MQPRFHRVFTTRTLTSSLALTFALAAVLGIAPLQQAAAQHAHHASASKAKPAAGKHRAHRAAASHAGHGGQRGTNASTREFHAAHERMMRNMALPYTGDADVDFRVQMIPHHQGAIDMARVALRHSKDPFTRQLAETVIIEQQREIAEMQAWLARRGAMVPPGGKPAYVGDSRTFLKPSPEPGTRAELAGQSWAPGTGIPASRPASK
ncbi:MAG: DUF305 domain-containing protein [Rhizobiales bacterium]|nr:DUF305 domain-containing protein [Hyphomicrobiales bacterium]